MRTMLLTLGMILVTFGSVRADDVIWDFEEGNDHGFILGSANPATPAPDDPTTAGDEAVTGVGGPQTLPGAGVAWTIGGPDQFDGMAPAFQEGDKVKGDGTMEYNQAGTNHPFAFPENDRGQESYLSTYNLTQWGDDVHTAENDQIATSPLVRLGDGAVLTVWAYGGGAGTQAPALDSGPNAGYVTGSAGVAVRSAADGALLTSVLTNGHSPMREDTIDLSAYAGQKVYIEVIDAFAGAWGWLAVDEIRITNAVDLGSTPELATNLNPGSGAIDVPRDVALGWDPGEFASTHDVYLGTAFDDVNTASRANPLAVLVSQGQSALSYDPEGLLELGQTYYWRVDEVNAAPDYTIFKGAVWSFVAEPIAYPVTNVSATASGADAGAGPERTIDGSGLNENDQHSTAATDMWLTTGNGVDPVWIQYEFDRVYKLHEMWVWNYNVMFELVLGFGLKDVTLEYSEDGTEWTSLGDVEFAKATAAGSYTHNTAVDLGGVAAKYVRLTVNSGWGMLGQVGLSEVRFLYIPAHAREPQPADEVAGVDPATALNWRAGRDAVSHEVYLGTDPETLELVDTVGTATYASGSLQFHNTYYWRVDEINEADTTCVWEGDLWSFATQDFALIEGFESYNDDDDLIFDTWVDGWVNETGSTVGYLEAPFAERAVVHSGLQSMPLFYDNASSATSETEFAFAAEDWTAGGIKSLSLYFYGAAGNSGQMYLKINNSKVLYDGDADALAIARWQPWNIDLSMVGGVSNVTNLIIGIEGAGAKGVVYVDDIRLYPQAPEYVTPAEPDTVDLVAHYALDGNANDSSSNGFNGVANGGPTYGAGRDGQVIQFDGVDDHIVIAGVGIAEGASRTISGWAKASQTGISAWTDVFGFTGPSGAGGHFDIECVGDTGTTTAGYYGLHRYGWEQDIIPIDLEWHHLAATYDGATVSWYGDGQLIGSTSSDAVPVVPPGQVHIGKREDNTNHFSGLVDEVRIYDVALSAEEIAWLAGRRAPMQKPF